MSALLEARNLSLAFGGVQALSGISFTVEAGEVFSIIGPNGAGKTTLFNVISRIYDADEGSIHLQGQDISALPSHRIAELGIARTFQNTELFEKETVLRNLLIGKHVQRRTSLLAEALFLPSVRRQELAFRREVEDIIDLLDLQHYRHQAIANLPYGVRKMVELARALCLLTGAGAEGSSTGAEGSTGKGRSAAPKLLLLDEPSSGLNPEESEDLSFQLEDINEALGATIIMVEHDMNLVSIASNRVMALADGKRLAVGTPAEVQAHPEVQKAYLGE